MTSELKIILGIITVSLIAVVAAVFFLGKPSSQTNLTPVDPAILVREDSQRVATDSAKVTVVEFSDFQCPACQAAQPVVKRMLTDYQGRVNFVYRHFPLTQHKNAFRAALAAEAAGEQGKFWEMHDKLFDTQENWELSEKAVEVFEGYAQELGLDINKFRADRDTQKLSDKVKRDTSDALALGVNSTPTFFINGIKTPGVLDYTDFKSKIDSELAR